MTSEIAAALALAVQTSVSAGGGTPLQSNLEYQMPVDGSWAYAAGADGSEATFANATGQTQLTIRCTRSARRISLIKAATTASPLLWVWTSSAQKSLPATFDPTATRVTAVLSANDSFLDAIAASRGRIGFSSSGLAALVVPPWGDVGRVIEDCRV